MSSRTGFKVLVAPNAFKGVLGSLDAARALAAGVRRAGAMPVLRPVADGGEGTAELLVRAWGGWQELTKAVDALGTPIWAPVGCLGRGRWAVDAASACGLGRLPRRNVMAASSFGLGLQLRYVLDQGAQQVFVGVGGTAFVDGGAGALAALGVRWLDPRGAPLPPTPSGLQHLAGLDVTGLHPRAREVEWILLTDVRNPLLGRSGAAKVYGPQKGAQPRDIPTLQRVFERILRTLRPHRHLDPSTPGFGAGGGLPLTFVALLGARIEPGGRFLSQALGIPEALAQVDLALTGEGRYDGQSAFGKAPQEVARLAARARVPAILVAGQIAPDADRGPFALLVEASGRLPQTRAQAEDDLARAAFLAVSAWRAEAGRLLDRPPHNAHP